MSHKSEYQVVEVFYVDLTQDIVILLENEKGETAWADGKRIESILAVQNEEVEDEDDPKPEGSLKHDPHKKGRSTKKAYTTSVEDVKKVRSKLCFMLENDKLTENEVEALKTLRGRHVSKMSEVQKQQILDIYAQAIKRNGSAGTIKKPKTDVPRET